jgi:hypothetical protein
MKSGNLNFLELSGPLQACNGTALSLPISVPENPTTLSVDMVLIFILGIIEIYEIVALSRICVR